MQSTRVFDSQVWNFSLYNGLGVAALIVVLLYLFFLFNKFKKREFDWAFEFAIGICIATLSRLGERIYYGVLRALQFETGDRGELLSPAWIISILATIGIIGLLFHIKTLSKHSFQNGVFKGALWVVLGTFLASFVWALVFP